MTTAEMVAKLDACTDCAEIFVVGLREDDCHEIADRLEALEAQRDVAIDLLMKSHDPRSVGLSLPMGLNGFSQERQEQIVREGWLVKIKEMVAPAKPEEVGK